MEELGLVLEMERAESRSRGFCAVPGSDMFVRNRAVLRLLSLPRGDEAELELLLGWPDDSPLPNVYLQEEDKC